MRTPAIPHYGTTLAESPPPLGVAQQDVPLTGMLGATDRFLRLGGFELLVRNLYPGVGRQYIYRRGEVSDADYLEKDCFTSYAAQPPPASDAPRVGETIFRLPHRDPRALYCAWRDERLATPLLGARAEAADDLLTGAEDDPEALRVLAGWYAEEAQTPAQLATWRRILVRAERP